MSNNPDKSRSPLELGPNANCKSQCTGRQGNPIASPFGLTNGNELNIVAKLLFTKRTYHLYENKGF
jgi:hypothetical protein